MRVLAGSVTAVAVTGAALVAVANPAGAASDPLPWLATELSTAHGPAEHQGGLSFYNADGAQIFSGSVNDMPMAAYIVGDGALLPSSTVADGATAYIYTPQQADPGLWNNTQISATAPVGAGVNAKYTKLPQAIQTSEREVVTPFDSVLDAMTQYPSPYPAPNDHVFEVRMIGASDQVWYSADIEVDPATSTWTQIYPVALTNTAVSAIVASPVSPAPAGTTSVRLSATLSPTNPSVPAGTVHLFDGTVDKGAAVLNSTTGAITDTVSGLINGSTHHFMFKFTPTDATKYSSSQSAALTYSVKSPDSTALTISKGAKIAFGKAVKISGAITDTTTHKALSGATVSLYAKVGTAAVKKVKDVKAAANGTFSFSTKPTRTTTYQWRYAATAAHKAVNSATDVITVSRTTTITATARTIKKGGFTKFYGVVAPVAGGNATLQRKSGARWLASGHATIKKQKLPNRRTAVGYVISWKGAAKGKFTLRVSVPGATGLAGVVSSMITITVK